MKIITLGDIFENLETEDKAFKFLKYIKELQQDYEKLEVLVELLYYKIELNDEQQELLNSILESKGE